MAKAPQAAALRSPSGKLLQCRAAGVQQLALGPGRTPRGLDDGSPARAPRLAAPSAAVHVWHARTHVSRWGGPQAGLDGIACSWAGSTAACSRCSGRPGCSELQWQPCHNASATVTVEPHSTQGPPAVLWAAHLDSRSGTRASGHTRPAAVSALKGEVGSLKASPGHSSIRSHTSCRMGHGQLLRHLSSSSGAASKGLLTPVNQDTPPQPTSRPHAHLRALLGHPGQPQLAALRPLTGDDLCAVGRQQGEAAGRGSRARQQSKAAG